ncbi:hypothetical protein ACFW1P_11305 [Paenibacillus sp. NPDC058910]|uniref:hypothetical protein n=1 Tax=unclassified Paenibacillus TaxID=185978 RepID=UPI0036A6D23C
MAKTYKAVGQQLTYVLRGLFTITALSLYFINPKLHWGIFICRCVYFGIVRCPMGGRCMAEKDEQIRNP